MRLLRQYALLLVAGLILVLIAVAVQQGLAWRATRQNQAAATSFLAIGTAIDGDGAAPTANQRLAAAKQYRDFAQTAPAGYRALAELRAAGLYAESGQPDAAAALWNTLAGDGGADQPLRDLANLLWAQHALGVAPDAQVSARLAPLEAAQNPFHGLAQETQALLYLREGKTAQAQGLFTQIAADPGAPDGVRNRADGLLAKLNAASGAAGAGTTNG
jgi:hypothetical protein